LVRLIDQVEKVLNVLESRAESNPFFAVVAAHHLARNLYPSDPYLQGNNSLDMRSKILKTVSEVELILTVSESYESYLPTVTQRVSENDVRFSTGEVYGQLWQKFPRDSIVSRAQQILMERFSKNNIDIRQIVKGRSLDAGCGSGRYTLAISEFCDTTIGVDFGDRGLEVATELRNTVAKEQSTNVSFIKADLLNLPFEDGSFDFVMSNGTAHHTTDPILALHEVVRVMKKGGHAFIYLYGSGGVFWYVRKRLNKIMKLIPQAYTSLVLKALGMPSERFIFEDNWYVPIEHHMQRSEVENVFVNYPVASFQRLTNGTATDLYPTSIEEEEFFGSGELRYLIVK
jgi:ubiquinone/menaquinone biosynthesis C-methylase UbiE